MVPRPLMHIQLMTAMAALNTKGTVLTLDRPIGSAQNKYKPHVGKKQIAKQLKLRIKEQS